MSQNKPSEWAKGLGILRFNFLWKVIFKGAHSAPITNHI